MPPLDTSIGRSPLGGLYRTDLGVRGPGGPFVQMGDEEFVGEEREEVEGGAYTVVNWTSCVVFTTEAGEDASTWNSETQDLYDNVEFPNCHFTFVSVGGSYTSLWPSGATIWITPSSWIQIDDEPTAEELIEIFDYTAAAATPGSYGVPIYMGRDVTGYTSPYTGVWDELHDHAFTSGYWGGMSSPVEEPMDMMGRINTNILTYG